MTKRDYKRPKERGQKHMPLFLNKEIIIKRFREKHGGKYDYSLVEFKGCDSHVSIICKVHGVFSQRADTHAEGKNCPKCMKRYKPTNEEFIANSKSKFKDKFNYLRAIYKNARTKITITCILHGDFNILPLNHLKSNGGCPKCSKNGKLSLVEFIEKANKQHSQKYDYSQILEFKNVRSKVKIRCQEHGDFLQIADRHLHGAGCPDCGVNAMKEKTSMGLEEFINQSNLMHDGKYDYSLVDYKNGYTKVKIVCPIHGIFEQRPHGHLQTRGCEDCGNESKFNFQRQAYIDHCNNVSNGISNLYVIHCTKGEESFFKIGITLHDVEKRFKNAMPYEYVLVEWVSEQASFIWDLEKRLHGLLKAKAYRPKVRFAGETECFSTITKEVERLLDGINKSSQLQLIA